VSKETSVHYFSIKERCFIYDIETAACAKVDPMALSILPLMLQGDSDNIVEEFAHLYPISHLKECVQECTDLLDSGMFNVGSKPYKPSIQENILSLCLHISHKCNMACEYCYAEEGTFGRPSELMSKDVMLKAIDFAFEHNKNGRELRISFFGGEPMLNFGLIQEGVAYAKKKGAEQNKKVRFSTTSNATLLDESKKEFLKREKFGLIFSLDGPQSVHDRMRKFKSGNGTHDLVLKNVTDFRDRYSDQFTIRGTFTRTTPNFSDQVVFLNDLGFISISVEPAQLEDTNPHAITTQSDLLRVKLEYDKLADIYLERFDQGNLIHFFHFDYVLRKLLSPHPMHTQCGAGGGLIAIIPDGSIFPCFESVVEEENCIGHIDEGFYDNPRKRFQKMHVDEREICRDCWVKYSCGGGCHALNIRYNNDILVPYKPYCQFMKHRFKLAAWILSEISDRGPDALDKLRTHLQVESNRCHKPLPENSKSV